MKKIKVNFINNHHHQITKADRLFHKHQIHPAVLNQSYYQIRVYISRVLAFVLLAVLLEVLKVLLVQMVRIFPLLNGV
jgi:hypothetical protein